MNSARLLPTQISAARALKPARATGSSASLPCCAAASRPSPATSLSSSSTSSPTRRAISTTCGKRSGHSRWATIRHDKAKNDAKLSKQRSYITKEVVSAVRNGGADPTTNSRLAALMVEAKRSSLPKASLERCILRGQGKSLSGAPLEALSLEFMFPPSVGGIVEAETDSRTRTMQELKSILRKHGASASPSAFLFDRRGKIVWGADGAQGLTEERVLESAIEAGALDVESSGGEGAEGADGQEIVVWTEVTEMSAVADQLTKALGSPPASQELAWKPKDDTKVPSFESEEFDILMSKINEIQEINEVYLNIA